MHKIRLCFFWATSALWVPILAQTDAPPLNHVIAPLDFKPCQIRRDANIVDALCSTFTRPENPNDREGKTIDIFVAKFPAKQANAQKDAFTVIQGGPGGSSIDLYLSYQSLFEGIRTKRDIIVVDQRGTGRSNILLCPDLKNEVASSFDALKTQALARRCMNGLDADLSFYTTSMAVQDLDAIRMAAGYEQLNIYGVSYGTRVAQHYLRRFPERVRSLILDGVVDVNINLAGGEIARQAQAAFDQVAKRCAMLDTCEQQFGDIGHKFNDLRQELEKKPATVSLSHPTSGNMITQEMTQEDLLGTVRMMSYSSEQLALLPMLISQAHSGNLAPLFAQSIMISDSLSNSYAVGMGHSVICAEDAPFVSTDDLLNLDETYLGPQMALAIEAICEVWPQGHVDDDFRAPIDSEKPVLILSGETDPITPPKNGVKANQMFKNSRHIVVPGHGHGVISRGCVPHLALNFVDQASFDEFDEECVSREIEVPFFLDFTGPTP